MRVFFNRASLSLPILVHGLRLLFSLEGKAPTETLTKSRLPRGRSVQLGGFRSNWPAEDGIILAKGARQLSISG
jgi:hypothetical protein